MGGSITCQGHLRQNKVGQTGVCMAWWRGGLGGRKPCLALCARLVCWCVVLVWREEGR